MLPFSPKGEEIKKILNLPFHLQYVVIWFLEGKVITMEA
jgi:hypothetical protein